MQLSDPPTTPQLDEYYKASMPDSDFLGDVDGFGLFHNWNPKQRLSEALRDYYVGTQEKPAGVNKRWLTFCRLNRFVTVEGNQVKWRAQSDLETELVRRVNNFCNLFAAGPKGAVKTMVTGKLHSEPWKYTGEMVKRFLKDVKDNLEKELGNQVRR
jgi:hypothetical protein